MTCYPNNQNKYNKGFTLIELLVVMGIIAIISAILFNDYPSVRDRIAVTSAAHKLSLAIREAQAYGSSAGEINGTSTLGQVVRVVTSSNINNNEGVEVLTFADNVSDTNPNDPSVKISNMKYDYDKGEEITSRSFGFEGGIKVTKILVTDNTGATTTIGDSVGNELEIYFMRPENRARIYSSSFPSVYSNPTSCTLSQVATSDTGLAKSEVRRNRNFDCYAGYKEADIELAAAGVGGYKCVKVFYIGQVTISNGKCE